MWAARPRRPAQRRRVGDDRRRAERGQSGRGVAGAIVHGGGRFDDRLLRSGDGLGRRLGRRARDRRRPAQRPPARARPARARRDRHRLLDDRLDLDRCLFDGRLDRLGRGRRGRLRLRDRCRVGQCGQRSQARREVEARFGVMGQAVGLMPAVAAVAVLAVHRLGGDRLGEVGARRRQVRERRGHDLVTEMRGAGQAACLGLVPAVRAGVLPALHAEVEGLVERVELVGGGFALGIAPRGGHRLVHGRVVGQDEVLQPARHDLDALQPGLRTRGLERVTSPATFAE